MVLQFHAVNEWQHATRGADGVDRLQFDFRGQCTEREFRIAAIRIELAGKWNSRVGPTYASAEGTMTISFPHVVTFAESEQETVVQMHLAELGPPIEQLLTAMYVVAYGPTPVGPVADGWQSTQ